MRLLLWTVGGGILWAMAMLVSALLCRALGQFTTDIPIAGLTIAQSDLQLALRISLHCSFAVILLGMLVSISRRKVLWEEVLLSFVALIVGPLSIAWPVCVKWGTIQQFFGSNGQIKELAVTVTGYGLHGLVLSAVARGMFAGMSPGLSLSWLLCGALGCALAMSVQTWPVDGAQESVGPFLSYACLGLIIAALLSATLLAEGRWRYLFLPVVSVSCYGVLGGARQVDAQWLHSAASLTATCLFGAAAQLGASGGGHLSRRVLIAAACGAAWHYSPQVIFGEFGGSVLLIGLVWFLWGAALKFHLRKWLEPGIQLWDLLWRSSMFARERRPSHG